MPTSQPSASLKSAWPRWVDVSDHTGALETGLALLLGDELGHQPLPPPERRLLLGGVLALVVAVGVGQQSAADRAGDLGALREDGRPWMGPQRQEPPHARASNRTPYTSPPPCSVCGRLGRGVHRRRHRVDRACVRAQFLGRDVEPAAHRRCPGCSPRPASASVRLGRQGLAHHLGRGRPRQLPVDQGRGLLAHLATGLGVRAHDGLGPQLGSGRAALAADADRPQDPTGPDLDGGDLVTGGDDRFDLGQLDLEDLGPGAHLLRLGQELLQRSAGRR